MARSDPGQAIEATTTVNNNYANYTFEVPVGQWRIKAQLTGSSDGPWSDANRFSVVPPDDVSLLTKPPRVFQPREGATYYLPAKIPVKVRHFPDPDPNYCMQYFYEVAPTPSGPWDDTMVVLHAEGTPSVNGLRMGSLHAEEEYYFRLSFRNNKKENGGSTASPWSHWRHFNTRKDKPGCTTLFHPDGTKILRFSPINMEIRHIGLTPDSQFHITLSYAAKRNGSYHAITGASLDNISTKGNITTATLDLPMYGYYLARVWFAPPGGLQPECAAGATYFSYLKPIKPVSAVKPASLTKQKYQLKKTKPSSIAPQKDGYSIFPVK